MRYLHLCFTLILLMGCDNTPKKTLIYENVIVFGDSFSDNGNVYRLTKGYYPGEAYYRGRFSNGPVWSEYFVKLLGIDPHDSKHFLNFAYGQGQILAPYTITITQDNGNKVKYTIPDLETQISDYLNHPVKNPDQSLFVVFIGTNDLLNLENPLKAGNLLKQMMSVLKKQIGRLQTSGANKILIINMPLLTISPYVCTASHDLQKHPQVSPKAYKAADLKLINEYNKLLFQTFQQDKTITLFDIDALETEIFTKIKLDGGFPYQFEGKNYVLKYAGDNCSNGEESCYTNHGNYQNQVSPICKNPEEYLLYDRIHPTTSAHDFIAKKIYKQLEESSFQ